MKEFEEEGSVIRKTLIQRQRELKRILDDCQNKVMELVPEENKERVQNEFYSKHY